MAPGVRRCLTPLAGVERKPHSEMGNRQEAVWTGMGRGHKGVNCEGWKKVQVKAGAGL